MRQSQRSWPTCARNAEVSSCLRCPRRQSRSSEATFPPCTVHASQADAPPTECAASWPQRAARPQGSAASFSRTYEGDAHVNIREFRSADLPALVDLTIEAFRPLFQQHLPDQLSRTVFAHDHGDWEGDYRKEVPTFVDSDNGRFITLAEEEGRILGYVGWNITEGALRTSGRRPGRG